MSSDLDMVRLGSPEVAEVVLGQSPPSASYNGTGDGLPFFQGKADFGLLYPRPRVWCTAGERFGEPGDVLVSVRAPVGDVNMARERCVIGRGIAAIRAGEGVDPWFLYFALLRARLVLAAQATGSTFASVNKATLQDLEIPHPAYPQQVAIGCLLRRIVERIAQEGRSVDIAVALKRAAMYSMFTRGLRGEGTRETELGPVPETWRISQCEDLTEEITVGVVVKPASYYVPNGVPAFRSLNIKEDRIDANSLVFFSAEDNETVLAKSKLSVGDVLVVRTGYPGTSCVVPQEFDGANCIDLVIVRPKVDRLMGSFLSRFLNSQQGRSQALANSHGLAQKHLNVGAVRQLKVPAPPSVDEQAEIVEILDVIDQKIRLHVRKREALDELFQSLLHKLMTGDIEVADLDLSTLATDSSDSGKAVA